MISELCAFQIKDLNIDTYLNRNSDIAGHEKK